MKISFTSAEEYERSDFKFEVGGDKRYVVLDLETTGPDADQDRVTQFGAVGFETHAPDEETFFECLVKPWKPIPPKIEELTGVTNARVEGAPDFATAFARFRDFYGEGVLVTQCGYEYDFTLLHPERSETISTNFLSDYCRIDRSEFQRHDAVGDAKLMSRIFRAELKEAKGMGVDSLMAGRLRIKGFLLKTLL